MQNIQEIIKEKGLVGIEVGQAEDIAKRLLGGVLELTEEEQNVILKMRYEKEQQERKEALSLKYLKVAAEYLAFLQNEGAGSTFTTFTDDFGYQGEKGENRSKTYYAVLDLIESSRTLAHAVVYGRGQNHGR